MQKLLFSMITVAALAFSSCGSDDTKCSDKGKCSLDTVPTEPYLSSCQATLAASCGSQWQALLNCVKANEKCDSSGNMDLPATQAVCLTQFADFATCCTNNPTAAGCS